MTRIVCMQNKLLYFMSLQIQNSDIRTPKSKGYHAYYHDCTYITRTKKKGWIPAHQIRCPNHG